MIKLVDVKARVSMGFQNRVDYCAEVRSKNRSDFTREALEKYMEETYELIEKGMLEKPKEVLNEDTE